MEKTTPTPETICADMNKLFEHRGGKSRLAEELGLTRQYIQDWLRNGVPDRWLRSKDLPRAIARLMKRVEKGESLTNYATKVAA